MIQSTLTLLLVLLGAMCTTGSTLSMHAGAFLAEPAASVRAVQSHPEAMLGAGASAYEGAHYAYPAAAAGTIANKDSAKNRRQQPTPELISLNLVASDRQDICELCDCKLQLYTVTCNLRNHAAYTVVFGGNWRVPKNTRKLIINANDKYIRLEADFFDGNEINSIIVMGNNSAEEQVEIGTKALNGNNGAYPEIRLHNLNTVIVHPKIVAGSIKLRVTDVNDLIIQKDAFENAKINCHFTNIKDLRMAENAFNSAISNLRIESSYMANLHRFGGSLHVIEIVKSNIGTIQNGTFDMNKINSTTFEGCNIGTIRTRAFTDKLEIQHVSITGGNISSIETEAIYGSGIEELILKGNSIENMHERAIDATAINVTMVNNNIKRVGKNGLQVKEWSYVVVNSNRFGIFGGISVEQTNKPTNCRFENNSITEPQSGCLNLNPHCVVREIPIDRPCICTFSWLSELTERDLRTEVYCNLDDKLRYCFNSSNVSAAKYSNEVCDEQKTELHCGNNSNLKRVAGKFYTREELADIDKSSIIPIVVGVAIILCVLAIVLICVCLWRLKGKMHTRHANDSQLITFSKEDRERMNKTHRHAFSQEDRDEISRSLNAMQKVSSKTYTEVQKCIQELYKNDLSADKCATLIAKILEHLHKLGDSRMNYQGLNLVLTQHLQPYEASTDPVYTEPNLIGTDHRGSNTINSLQTNLAEPIYAEPNCPLLRNDYASPADRNMESMDLYTEPIRQQDTNAAPAAAYAVSVPQQLQRLPQYAAPQRNQQNHATARTELPQIQNSNLPDVLYRSKGPLPQKPQIPHNSQMHDAAQKRPPSPLTNVKKIAQDLQNMPKFHVNPFTLPSAQAPPVYKDPHNKRSPHATSQRQIGSKSSNEARLAAPEIDDCETDMRGAMALPPDSGSDHSGGSDVTVQIDDVILYADA